MDLATATRALTNRRLDIDAAREIGTANPRNTTGACYGDSGGPQVRLIDGRWALIGVTSRAGNNSPVCATGPSVYGDLPSIHPWVNTQTGGPTGLIEAAGRGLIRT